MSSCTVVTGFPGFLATHFFRAAAAADPARQWVFLVLPSELALAWQELNTHTLAPEQVQVWAADITKPHLGLSTAQSTWLRARVTHFFHFAALYDLTSPQAVTHKINVDGTRHVLEFLRDTPLQLLTYISTCFVAGKKSGLVRESELDATGPFQNWYEATKNEAEALVRQCSLPTLIIRPAIVVGHSQTGDCAKFDGPMVFLRFLKEWGPLLRVLPGGVPNLGFLQTRVSTVPVDVVVKTIATAGFRDELRGKCLHVVDPSIPDSETLYQFLVQQMLQRSTYRIPLVLRRAALRALQIFPLPLLTGMPAETIDYFFLDAQFESTQFRAFWEKELGSLPHYQVTYPPLVEFVRKQQRPLPQESLKLQYFVYLRVLLAALLCSALFLIARRDVAYNAMVWALFFDLVLALQTFSLLRRGPRLLRESSWQSARAILIGAWLVLLLPAVVAGTGMSIKVQFFIWASAFFLEALFVFRLRQARVL